VGLKLSRCALTQISLPFFCLPPDLHRGQAPERNKEKGRQNDPDSYRDRSFCRAHAQLTELQVLLVIIVSCFLVKCLFTSLKWLYLNVAAHIVTTAGAVHSFRGTVFWVCGSGRRWNNLYKLFGTSTESTPIFLPNWRQSGGDAVQSSSWTVPWPKS